MANRRSRYKIMERNMTCVLIGDSALFLLYLLFAGLGIVWLKIVIAILAILISLACLAFLYLSQELLKKRSLWMSAAAAAIALCTLMSLVLNYPRPNTYKNIAPEVSCIQESGHL